MESDAHLPTFFVICTMGWKRRPGCLGCHLWPSSLQLLNCIMDMVEKTRRSLTVLRRCQEADREELNHWIRRYSDAEDMKKGPSPASRPLSSTANLEAPLLGTPAREEAGSVPPSPWRPLTPGTESSPSEQALVWGGGSFRLP